MRVALINTNRMEPPIAPIGLEYVAEALGAAGFDVELCDLCGAEDWKSLLAGFFHKSSFGLVGATLRNTDDCAFAGRRSFLGEFTEMVDAIRTSTDAPVVIGGAGFSVMPEDVLSLCGADAGVWGDGEFAFAEIAGRIDRGEEWSDCPNIVLRRDGIWHRNAVVATPLEGLPRMMRNRFDNERYFRDGGQAGIETKRGCPRHCVYCADPIAKGKTVRTRPPAAVADELEALLGQGIDHIHTCDSEFNIPEDHALEVCREFIKRGLGDRLRWYAYCSPVPFPAELARLMARAGCVGINFGVDSGDDRMLKRLGRAFTADDIVRAAGLCGKERITVMFDLLLGAPGESRESIINTVELARRAGADRVGVAYGVRVFQGTALAGMVASERAQGGLSGGDGPDRPLFFLEPEVAGFISKLLEELVGEDRRFLFLDPARPERNYNYNANRLLSDAIRRGYRGAYWDILRRIPEERGQRDI